MNCARLLPAALLLAGSAAAAQPIVAVFDIESRAASVSSQTLAALTDLLAGQVQLTFGSSTSLPYVRQGRLVAIAVTSSKRMSSVPNLPTIAESGLPGYEVLNWFGVTSPAKMPPAILAKLNAAFARSLQYPDAREKLTGEGSELVGNSSAEFTAFLKSDLAKWAKVVKEAGIKID